MREDVIDFQETIIKITRDKWNRRLNNPVSLWIQRLLVWMVFTIGWGSWEISSYGKSAIGFILAFFTYFMGVHLAIRELKHKN